MKINKFDCVTERKGISETIAQKVVSRHKDGTSNHHTNAEPLREYPLSVYLQNQTKCNELVNYRCGCCPYTGYGGAVAYCCCVRA
jgi:hypothetical protein